MPQHECTVRKHERGSCQTAASVEHIRCGRPQHVGTGDLRMLERHGGHKVAHISTTTTPERSPMDSGAPLTKCRSAAGMSGQAEQSDLAGRRSKEGSCKYNLLTKVTYEQLRAGVLKRGAAGVPDGSLPGYRTEICALYLEAETRLLKAIINFLRSASH